MADARHDTERRTQIGRCQFGAQFLAGIGGIAEPSAKATVEPRLMACPVSAAGLPAARRRYSHPNRRPIPPLHRWECAHRPHSISAVFGQKHLGPSHGVMPWAIRRHAPHWLCLIRAEYFSCRGHPWQKTSRRSAPAWMFRRRTAARSLFPTTATSDRGSRRTASAALSGCASSIEGGGAPIAKRLGCPLIPCGSAQTAFRCRLNFVLIRVPPSKTSTSLRQFVRQGTSSVARKRPDPARPAENRPSPLK